MNRGKIIFTEVSELYSASTTPMGKWMWQNHAQWVANKARQLAEKYNADTDKDILRGFVA